MAIEPISGVAAIEPLPAQPVRAVHSPSPNVQLHAAAAIENASVEQLAVDGDAMAVDKLAEEKKKRTVIDTQPKPLQPARYHVGPHEPGKGELIDIYD